jgi:hypothetical protein
MPGSDYHFFEIGIYRCPIDQHTDELARDRQKCLEPLERTKSVAPVSYAKAGDWFDREHWYPWRYNEVIGWLRLYRLGSQIRGELWFVNAKRITRGMKKRFFCFDRAFELRFRPSQSEEDIRAEVLAELKRVAGERPIKGRYLDLECFLVAAPLLRWRALLGFEPNGA